MERSISAGLRPTSVPCPGWIEVRSAATVPEVQAVYTIAGDPDALVHVRVRDLAHLQSVIDTLRRAGTETLMVLGSWSREG